VHIYSEYAPLLVYMFKDKPYFYEKVTLSI